MIELLAHGSQLPPFEFGDFDGAPSLSGADQRAEHQLEDGVLAEGVRDDLQTPSLLDKQPLKQVRGPDRSAMGDRETQMRERANDHVTALRALGASVYEFKTEAVYWNDLVTLQRQIEEIQAFAPDAVIGTQQAGYALHGGMIYEPTLLRKDQSLSKANLFLDVLRLPTILYWDHALTQAARYVLFDWPSLPDDSEHGVMRRLEHVLTHPQAMHFIPDSGHVAELQRIGLVSFDYDPHFVTAVSQVFLQRESGSCNWSEEVSFFGNIYLSASKRVPYADWPCLAKLRESALEHCQRDWDLPPYFAYRDAIAELTQENRSTLKIDWDQSFYWRFLHDELSFIANGERRFQILTACKRPVAFYGGFEDSDSREVLAERSWLLRESLPHDGSLAEAYRSTKVTLDVVNAPFVHGFSPKLLECFAAGGFMLSTRKRDMSAAFGSLADVIGYSNADELAAKIDFYLSHESERNSIVKEMQEIIRRDHTALSLFARTLPEAIEGIRARGNQ